MECPILIGFQKIMMCSIDWKDIFYYDESSPSGLRWKIKSGNKLAGDVAGGKSHNPDGSAKAWEIGYGYDLYKAHRIIWILVNGSIDAELNIDHIDGDSFNNKIDNLRLVTQSINLKNRRMQKTNTSGKTGVIWRTRNDSGVLYALARVELEGKVYSKWFNTEIYGKDRAFELASEWRDSKIKELGVFTERHGK